MNDSLKEQRVFNKYGFISQDNVLRTYLGKVLIYDLQTHTLALNFVDFLINFFHLNLLNIYTLTELGI